MRRISEITSIARGTVKSPDPNSAQGDIGRRDQPIARIGVRPPPQG